METYSGWLGPLEGLELTGEAEIDNLDKEQSNGEVPNGVLGAIHVCIAITHRKALANTG